MAELKCLCGIKGGTPVYFHCQGEAVHKYKAEVNKAMKSLYKHLPELAKTLGYDGQIKIVK